MSWSLPFSEALMRLREAGQRWKIMHDRGKSRRWVKEIALSARGWRIRALASAARIMAAICNQDLCSPARERNFRPSDSRLRSVRPGGERGCHLIPKVSRANITPAISQVLRAGSSHLCEGGKRDPSPDPLPPLAPLPRRRKKSSWTRRARWTKHP